jgi:hypothetical protein
MNAMFSLLSLLLILSAFFLFILLHARGKEYKILSNAVSDYALGSTAKLFVAYLSVSVLAYACLGMSLVFSPAGLFRFKDIIFIFLVVALRIGLAVFKTDLEGEKLTPSGILHYVLAVASFASLYMFVDGSVTDLKKLPSLASYSSLLTGFSIAFTVSLILNCVTLVPKLRKVFGLFERIYLVLGNLWILLLSLFELTLKYFIS